jgi:hypothetical protein
MGTSSSMSEAVAKVERSVDNSVLSAMAKAGGMAAKKSALKAAADSLGGDRKMSGFKRGGALNAGFDLSGGTSVTVNFRPARLWKLAEEGRKGSKRVTAGKGRRKGAGGARAFRTPDGPRAAFTSGPSRGLKTLTHAQQDAARDAPKAAFKEFQSQLGKVF